MTILQQAVPKQIGMVCEDFTHTVFQVDLDNVNDRMDNFISKHSLSFTTASPWGFTFAGKQYTKTGSGKSRNLRNLHISLFDEGLQITSEYDKIYKDKSDFFAACHTILTARLNDWGMMLHLFPKLILKLAHNSELLLRYIDEHPSNITTDEKQKLQFKIATVQLHCNLYLPSRLLGD